MKYRLTFEHFIRSGMAWKAYKALRFADESEARAGFDREKANCPTDMRLVLTLLEEGNRWEGEVLDVYQPSTDPPVKAYAAGHVRYPDQIDWLLLGEDWVYRRLVVQGLIQRLEDESEPHCVYCGGTDLKMLENGRMWCNYPGCVSRYIVDADGIPVDCRLEDEE